MTVYGGAQHHRRHSVLCPDRMSIRISFHAPPLDMASKRALILGRLSMYCPVTW